MPWHSSGGMSTACGGRGAFSCSTAGLPFAPEAPSAAHLGVLALVLLHDEVTERMVLPHEENVTAQAVPPGWRKDGSGARAQGKAAEQPC